MASKPKLSLRFVECEGTITITASFPTEQIKNCLWGIIGSGTVWIGSHFLTPPSPSLPPANLPAQTTQPTIGK
jgi:hypothetical protein